MSDARLYALVNDRHYCSSCFFRGPGRSWPRRLSPKVVTLSEDDVALARMYARAAELGGRSNIRSSDRRETLVTDQFVGQVCTLAYHLHRYGAVDRYIASREEANKNPWKGDGGSDDPGLKHDVKGSLMRAGSDWRRYRLAVRPRERHRGNSYILALMAQGEPVEVSLVGWARESDLPSQPETSGPFAGAFTLPATRLNDISSICG